MTPKTTIPNGLLTEQQVLDALKKEVDFTSLTAVANKYGLKASQVSDALNSRCNLSKRMVARLSYKLHKFYERVPNGSK